MVVQILHTLLAFSAVANLTLGLIVISQKRKDESALWFFMTTVGFFLWSSTFLLLLKTNIYLFYPIAVIGGTISMSCVGLFVSSLVKSFSFKESVLIKFFFIFYMIFFSLVVLIPGLIIKPGIIIVNQMIVTNDPSGPFQLPLTIYSGLIFLFYLFFLNRAYREALGEEKKKVRNIAWATIISGLVAMTTNVLMPTFNISYGYAFGTISTFAFTATVAYLIVKHHFFSLKVLFYEIIVFIFLAYIGALVFLAEDLSDFSFKLVSFIITLVLSIILLKSVNNEMKLKAEVEQTYQKQSNFLADIAHKLKTPLTIVRANNDMAKYSMASGQYQEAKESIDMSIRAVSRLAQMSTNLVTLGKIDFGLSKLSKHKFDLSELIASSVVDFKPMLGLRKMTSEIEPGIEFIGDSSRIQEMLFNLLDNAVKFTDEEEGKIKVSLKTVEDRQRLRSPYRQASFEVGLSTNIVTEQRNGHHNPNRQTIELTISDNGIGIDKTVLPNLFTRYYQAESRSGSAGIGLAICKWIVEGHGGKIEIESKKGEGTAFRIVFGN